MIEHGDKFADALVELVRSGAPLARTAIHWHYATRLAEYAVWLLIFAGGLWFAFSLAKQLDRYWRDRHGIEAYRFEVERRKRIEAEQAERRR